MSIKVTNSHRFSSFTTTHIYKVANVSVAAAYFHPRVKSIPVWGFLRSTAREPGQIPVAEGI